MSSWTDKDVEKHWDTVASRYVEENNRVKDTHDQRFSYSIPYLKLQKGHEILNISSRDGEAATYIEKQFEGIRIINAEISAGLMQVAHELNPALTQVKINTYSSLPFADESFDRVLTLETLEHAADPVLFLKELHRVTRPKALMVLSCPPATSEIPYQIYTALFGGHGEGPHKFPSSKQVKKWLHNTGWQLVQHKGTVLLPVGPRFLKNIFENLIQSMQGTFISELGIRQFYVCIKH